MTDDQLALCALADELAADIGGWRTDLEYELWAAIIDGHHTDLSSEDLSRLHERAFAAGGWVQRVGDETVWIPQAEWSQAWTAQL